MSSSRSSKVTDFDSNRKRVHNFSFQRYDDSLTESHHFSQPPSLSTLSLILNPSNINNGPGTIRQ